MAKPGFESVAMDVSWSQSFRCPDCLPKNTIYSLTFALTNYTCGQIVLPSSIFAPSNITTLEEVMFADVIGVSRFEPQLAE